MMHFIMGLALCCAGDSASLSDYRQSQRDYDSQINQWEIIDELREQTEIQRETLRLQNEEREEEELEETR